MDKLSRFAESQIKGQIRLDMMDDLLNCGLLPGLMHGILCRLLLQSDLLLAIDTCLDMLASTGFRRSSIAPYRKRFSVYGWFVIYLYNFCSLLSQERLLAYISRKRQRKTGNFLFDQ